MYIARDDDDEHHAFNFSSENLVHPSALCCGKVESLALILWVLTFSRMDQGLVSHAEPTYLLRWPYRSIVIHDFPQMSLKAGSIAGYRLPIFNTK